MKEILGEKVIRYVLQGSGACNDAYIAETETGKKYIEKQEKAQKEFHPQNSLGVEGRLLQLLSTLNISIPTPKVISISENDDSFVYEYIEGDLLINVWQDFTEEEKLLVCKELGKFHADIGAKVTKQMVSKVGILINTSVSLHPEVEKEVQEILLYDDIPSDWIILAEKAKKCFDQTHGDCVFQFIHNDAHHENVIMKDKKIAGIIDFGESEYGEIAKEFSRYIRDFPEYFEHIVTSYEESSGNTISRSRIMTNSFLSGLIDNVEDYRKGGEHKMKAEKLVGKYKDYIMNLDFA